MSALGSLQTAIYSTLDADATLDAKITGIYDQVPQSTAFPYVTLGEWDELDASTFGLIGRECVLTVHVWSRYRGFSEAYSILEDLVRLLDRAQFSPAGFALVSSDYEGANTLTDPDGETRHIAARFRFQVDTA